jgi:hypothetical protein
MTTESILWRRLDAPGHDACRLVRTDEGWQLDGAVAFRHDGDAARLAYRVACDGAWRTRHGTVHGWVGHRPVDVPLRRTAGGVWTLDGRVVPEVGGCVDLDLGFTPATNLFQLRRLALEVGQAADAPVAWWDLQVGTLEVLQQRYERRTERAYWYEAPRFGYAALLEVDEPGFVLRYPGLWEAER